MSRLAKVASLGIGFGAIGVGIGIVYLSCVVVFETIIANRYCYGDGFPVVVVSLVSIATLVPMLIISSMAKSAFRCHRCGSRISMFMIFCGIVVGLLSWILGGIFIFNVYNNMAYGQSVTFWPLAISAATAIYGLTLSLCCLISLFLRKECVKE